MFRARCAAHMRAPLLLQAVEGFVAAREDTIAKRKAAAAAAAAASAAVAQH